MFITKKRFEAELDKARCEVQEKMWQDQEKERMRRDIYEMLYKLAERVDRLEGKDKMEHDKVNIKAL